MATSGSPARPTRGKTWSTFVEPFSSTWGGVAGELPLRGSRCSRTEPPAPDRVLDRSPRSTPTNLQSQDRGPAARPTTRVNPRIRGKT